MVRGQGNREVRSRDATGEREEVKQGIKYSQFPLQVTEPGGSISGLFIGLFFIIGPLLLALLLAVYL